MSDELLDDILRPGAALGARAWFSGNGPPNDFQIALGYQHAAAQLIESYRGDPMIDLVVFPICYLMRHCLELVLKVAIRETWKINGESGVKKVRSSHKLDNLINRLDRELEKMGEKPLPEMTRKTVEIVHRLDPQSDRFRYKEARDSSAASFASDEAFTLDLGGLRVQVEDAFLSIAYVGQIVDDRLMNQADWEADRGPKDEEYYYYTSMATADLKEEEEEPEQTRFDPWGE